MYSPLEFTVIVYMCLGVVCGFQHQNALIQPTSACFVAKK